VAPVSPYNVQPFDFLGLLFALEVFLQCRLLFLLVQQHFPEQAVQFDLQVLLQQVDFLFESLSDFDCLSLLDGLGVDHDAVGVPLNDVQIEFLLGQLLGFAQVDASVPSDQFGDVDRKEAGLVVAQAALE